MDFCVSLHFAQVQFVFSWTNLFVSGFGCIVNLCWCLYPTQGVGEGLSNFRILICANHSFCLLISRTDSSCWSCTGSSWNISGQTSLLGLPSDLQPHLYHTHVGVDKKQGKRNFLTFLLANNITILGSRNE